MGIISDYTIVVGKDRKVDFVVDSGDAFKSYGVSLFAISIARLYGYQNNFLTKNSDYINYISKLGSKENTAQSPKVIYDFCWQHEVYVDCLDEVVQVEKWGLCTRISKDEFLEIFKDIHLFLNRWIDKKVLIEAIKKAFLFQKSEAAKKLFFIKQPTKIETDQIMIALRESDFDIEVEALIKDLEFPIHMKEE